jgi:ribosomal protein L3 glutamine methyltransferase
VKRGEIERRLARARLHYGHGTLNAKEEALWLSRARQRSAIQSILEKRIRERKPLAYLLREAWLGPYPFYVDERVIVPRSFIAELLRDRLEPWLRRKPRRALDLCTGSGCLAVLLALTFRGLRVDASDVSRDALRVARINVNRYRLGRRIRLRRSDLFDALNGKYDLIVCNPPYVTGREMRKLPKEYRHEPRLALAAGEDGLRFVRRIIRQAKAHLAPAGLLVCEIGGNRKALERAYPGVEFIWPETSDTGTVFILGREQLPSAASPNRRSRATRDRPDPARARARSRRAPRREAA